MAWIEKDGRTVEEARAATVAAFGLPEEELEIEVLHEGARGLFGLGGEPAVVRARPRAEAPDFRYAFHDRPPGFTPPRTIATEEDLREPVREALTQRPVSAGQAVKTVPPEEQVTEPATVEDGVSTEEKERIAAELGAEMVRGILERMELQGEVRTRSAGGTVYIEVFGENMGILIGRGGATLEALQELVRAGVQRRLKARGSIVVDVESYWDRRRGRRSGSSERPESTNHGDAEG